MFGTIKTLGASLIQGLFPTIRKNDLKEKINKIQTKITDKIIPNLEDATLLLSNNTFKSKTLRDLDSLAKRSMQGTINGFDNKQNMLFAFLFLFKNAQTLLTSFRAVSDKVFDNTTPTTALKLRQAYILSMVNSASFAQQYILKLLNYIYSEEMFAISNNQDYKLVKANEKYIIDNFNNFLIAMRVFNIRASDVAKSIERISEFAGADPNSIDALVSTQKREEIDPLKLGYITEFSPFYIIGMWVAEIEAYFVKKEQDEVEILTRRRIRLEELYNGSNDALADKEIDAIQERIDDANANLDEYRRRYKF